ncbi:unnamed protein product, partial [Iphiclides podalirius]
MPFFVMVKTLVGCIVCLITAKVAEPRWRPITKPTSKQHNVYIPEDLGKESLINMKVPNNAFCSKMYKMSLGQYIILPWWYNLCEGLRERSEIKRSENYNRHRWALKWLNEYRKSGSTVPTTVRLVLAHTKRL